MTVKEMVIENIKKAGADGLCLPEQECGCMLSQLEPCDSMMSECQLAWVGKEIKREGMLSAWLYASKEQAGKSWEN